MIWTVPIELRRKVAFHWHRLQIMELSFCAPFQMMTIFAVKETMGIFTQTRRVNPRQQLFTHNSIWICVKTDGMYARLTHFCLKAKDVWQDVLFSLMWRDAFAGYTKRVCCQLKSKKKSVCVHCLGCFEKDGGILKHFMAFNWITTNVAYGKWLHSSFLL